MSARAGRAGSLIKRAFFPIAIRKFRGGFRLIIVPFARGGRENLGGGGRDLVARW